MKKLLLSLATGLLATATYAQNCNIGNQDSLAFGSTSISYEKDYLFGIRLTLADTGNLTSLNLLGRTPVNVANTKVRMAVYADSSGVPTNLIVATDSAAIIPGLNSFSVTPIGLSAGSYWLMAIYNNDGNHIYNQVDTSYVGYYLQLPFNGTIPTNATGFLTYPDDKCGYFLGITCVTTGVETMVSANNVNLYPNPAKDLLTVQIVAEMIGQNYAIIDQLGRQVLIGKITNETTAVDISQLQVGMYFLKVGAQSTQTFKFVKN